MANVQHASLTGSDIHEPKGANSASSNTVYVANGSGSGTWQQVASGQINTASIKNLNQITLNLQLDDLATAQSWWVVCPLAGVITKIYTVLHKAIATADVVLTPQIAGTNITNGAITIATSSSAAGDVDVATPTGARTVTAGQAIEIAGNGGTDTSTAVATVTILVDVS
mgnify:CR=1 FL=1|jgi:hypothetical protein|tara:strand:+ start:3191 stop:3697 length:507 start_codon:yes stop_codon:yes gene_type:complete